ncbi:MAG: GxxExxY protein [Planctomycetaceae bacterium]|nr:GxxExxY protein [Planctomycetaceae bacterium]
MLVEGRLLIKIKLVQEVHPIHKAQLLSFIKLMDVPVRLVVNFHEMKLVDGVHRMLLPGTNRNG